MPVALVTNASDYAGPPAVDALAAADVGIAMGEGTDVALKTAGIALMRGDPRLVAEAIHLSRTTYTKIRQNLFWAFAYNTVAIPVAAAGRAVPRRQARGRMLACPPCPPPKGMKNTKGGKKQYTSSTTNII